MGPHADAGNARVIGDVIESLDGILTVASPTASLHDRTFLGSVFVETGAQERHYADRLVLAPDLDPEAQGFDAQMRELMQRDAAGVIIRRPEKALANIAPELAERLILLDDGADWADTAQSIRALSSGSSSLVASGIQQGDLFSLANTLASLAGDAVSLVDTAGRIVGYSTHPDQPLDALRRKTTLSLREAMHPDSDEEFQQLAAATGSLEFPGHGSRYGRVAVSVRAAGEILGTVWIVQSEPSRTPETQRFLDSVVPLVAHHMLRARQTAQADERRSTDLLRALVDDAKSLRAAAARLGLNPGAMHTVVCFRVVGESSANPVLDAQQLVHRTATTAKAQFAWSHCAILDGLTVALIGSADVVQIRQFAERVTLASVGGVVAGIGRIADTHTQIPRSYRDAARISHMLAAARTEVGADPDSGANAARAVADYAETQAELRVTRLVEMLDDPELLEGDDAERILAHDRDNQSQLAPTLLAFLNHQGSVRKVAAALHVHQNTVRYRLDSIQTELGIDLDHAATRLWLWLRLLGDAHASDNP
ncbi:helix-turn-helix domain-containing protein [Agrococcus sp. ARC_14]|uniref:PucR family transcriptional regulator n=1 Tax=Agrococcus sp. ARC_14 TaxID=2919927 RepID=UPI001F05ACE1|nr:helix-turn-helix domain-containing protein [Agrococcus sp. ARC_14]MCH1883983.1 helix-turn-helix domain-containing protein [Agrococcus sp. ARC_14]